MAHRDEDKIKVLQMFNKALYISLQTHLGPHHLFPIALVILGFSSVPQMGHILFALLHNLHLSLFPLFLWKALLLPLPFSFAWPQLLNHPLGFP